MVFQRTGIFSAIIAAAATTVLTAGAANAGGFKPGREGGGGMGFKSESATNTIANGNAEVNHLGGFSLTFDIPGGANLGPSNVQLELLKRHRNGDTDERVVQGIHLTINGISAGLRNSG